MALQITLDDHSISVCMQDATAALQVEYQMRLSNNLEVCLVAYLVHAQPLGSQFQDSDDSPNGVQTFQWACVTRGTN